MEEEEERVRDRLTLIVQLAPQAGQLALNGMMESTLASMLMLPPVMSSPESRS